MMEASGKEWQVALIANSPVGWQQARHREEEHNGLEEEASGELAAKIKA